MIPCNKSLHMLSLLKSVFSVQQNANAPDISRNTFFKLVEEVFIRMLKAGKKFLFMFLFTIIPYKEETSDPDLEEGGRTTIAAESKYFWWSTIILTYCFAWVVGCSFIEEETKLQRAWLYSLTTVTATMAFGSILISHLISVTFPIEAHASLVVGVLSGVVSFFMAASIKLSFSFIWVVWFIFSCVVVAIVARRLSTAGESRH